MISIFVLTAALYFVLQLSKENTEQSWPHEKFFKNFNNNAISFQVNEI